MMNSKDEELHPLLKQFLQIPVRKYEDYIDKEYTASRKKHEETCRKNRLKRKKRKK